MSSKQPQEPLEAIKDELLPFLLRETPRKVAPFTNGNQLDVFSQSYLENFPLDSEIRV